MPPRRQPELFDSDSSCSDLHAAPYPFEFSTFDPYYILSVFYSTLSTPFELFVDPNYGYKDGWTPARCPSLSKPEGSNDRMDEVNLCRDNDDWGCLQIFIRKKKALCTLCERAKAGNLTPGSESWTKLKVNSFVFYELQLNLLINVLKEIPQCPSCGVLSRGFDPNGGPCGVCVQSVNPG